MRTLPLLVLLALTPAPAWAYIGPGLGAGTVSVILGFVVSILLALFAILWYPLKRLLKSLKKGASPPPERDDSRRDPG